MWQSMHASLQGSKIRSYSFASCGLCRTPRLCDAPRVYCVSGDVRRRRRVPAFDALMTDARRRRFDCVLVWKYDRFARSLGTLVSALQEFQDLGMDFISYTQAIDTTTPMDRLFFYVIGSFAEFERDVIVERVRAGLANARAKGKRLGRPVRDPAAQARIVALKSGGLSQRQRSRRSWRRDRGHGLLEKLAPV